MHPPSPATGKRTAKSTIIVVPSRMKRFTPGIALLLCVSLVDARQEKQTCGTHADTWREELQLHRRASHVGVKRLKRASAVKLAGQREVDGKTVLPDVGNLAVLDDADGVVARRNPFNLNARTLLFVPVLPTIPAQRSGRDRRRFRRGRRPAGPGSAGAWQQRV